MTKSRLSFMAILAVTSVSVFTGCGSDNSTTASVINFIFSSVPVPTTDAEKSTYKASDKITVNGKDYALEYNTLARTGDTGGASSTEVFGLVKNVNEQPITIDGKSWVCENGGANDNLGSGPDHTSIIKAANGKLYMTTQFECPVGANYSMEVAQDSTTGKLTAKKETMKYISTKDYHGSWVHCAGSVSPWNTHLGSEEYEPDASLVNATSGYILKSDGVTIDAGNYYNQMNLYFGDQKLANPYYYGWTPEISYDANGQPTFVKHYALGRFAHELAYVMPDSKTVYQTDDGTNCILSMFVADTAKDLSAGTLYVAKWNQTSGTGAGAADIKWINAGHATDAEIKAFVDAKHVFSDIFDMEVLSADKTIGSGSGVCSTGYTSTNANAAGVHECLKVKSGMEKIASRLETRRYAGVLGATTEFRKEEGLAFNPDTNKLYIAMSDISNGMLDNDIKKDLGGNNDIRLAKNSCGAVYQSDVVANVKDTNASTINSSYVISNMSGLVIGTPKTYTDTSLATNTCDVEGIASPDNITYLPGKNTLVIGEDTSGHQNDMIWSYDTVKGTLTRIFTTPYGSETTSPYWYPNINNFGYLMTVIQHPYGESDQSKAPSEASKANYVGVIQGFPALDK